MRPSKGDRRLPDMHLRRRAAALAALAVLLPACGGSNVQHLLDTSASGNADTSAFRPKGAWDLVYSWDCSSAAARHTPDASTFSFTVLNADDDTLAAQQPTTARTGRSGKGTLHYTRSGPYYVEITTVCDWRVQVVTDA